MAIREEKIKMIRIVREITDLKDLFVFIVSPKIAKSNVTVECTSKKGSSLEDCKMVGIVSFCVRLIPDSIDFIDFQAGL